MHYLIRKSSNKPIAKRIRSAFRMTLLAILFSQTGCVTKTEWQDDSSIDLSSSEYSSAKVLKFNEQLFEPSDDITERNSITQLSEQQQRDFLEYFNQPSNLTKPAYRRVYNYLTKIMNDFTYDTKTYTAEQTLTNKSGDCLSLAILTTSYAHLADLRISYHLMDNNPFFELGDNRFLTSNHIRTVLRNKKENGRSTQIGGIRIDYFPSKSLQYIDNMPTEMPISMFYSNIAVEKLEQKEYDQAYSYARKALEISAENSSALNTIGVLHKRRGDHQSAERIYEYGATFLRNKAMFLRNKVVLLESQSRFSEAQQVLEEIHLLPSEHPWQWLHAGRVAYRQGKYSEAVKFYGKALSISPNLHKVHIYSAIANYRLGRYRLTKEHLKLAIDNAPDDSARDSYELKLAALQ